MATWRVIDQKIPYRDGVLELSLERIRTPKGAQGRWTVVSIGDGAAVLPVEEDGSMHLIRQYRHAVGEALWELPAGRLEAGESALQAARRELAEECGLAAGSMEPLGPVIPLAGICRHVVHLFLARDLSAVPAAPELFEDIEVARFDATEVDAMIRSGEIRCGIALAALCRHRAFGRSSG